MRCEDYPCCGHDDETNPCPPQLPDEIENMGYVGKHRAER